MENSKLIGLLQSLDESEIREVRDFVDSPFFNKNPEVSGLMRRLAKKWPEFAPHKIRKEKIFRELFPGRPFDARKFSHLMNYLLKLCEQYLAVKRFQADDLLFNCHVLGEFVDRKLDKHYSFLQQRTVEKIERNGEKNGKTFLYQFLLAETGVHHFYNRRVREFDPGMQVVSDKLDEFYFFNKLKYSCEMLNRQAILFAPYKIPFVDKVEAYLLSREDLDPLVGIYLRIYLCLVFPDQEQHFLKLKKLIETHSGSFEKKERREIYLYAINYCAGKIRIGNENYIPVVLQLYQEGIANKSLFEGEYLSHWTFTNVVKLALRLERYQWIEEFIREYSPSLDVQFREDAQYFNLAELYYHKKEWNKTLENLSRLNFTDIHYHLGSRVILIKTYYEQGAIEPLASQLAAFSMYLRRNKTIAQPLKETYLNFCNLMHRLINNNPRKREATGPLINSIQLLAERSWLQRVWEEVIKKER